MSLKKGLLFTASTFFRSAIAKELGEQLSGYFPVFTVYAIFHFGRFYFTLYQSSVF